MEYLQELIARYGITTGQQWVAGVILWFIVYYLLSTHLLRQGFVVVTAAAFAVFILFNGG